MSVTAVFLKDKETKNTVRFEENVPDGEQAKIGMIYVQKSALATLGDVDRLEVTLTASE